ncbi:MAG: hypothetical protein ACR2J8_10855 [Thermomicrobiales bacterium]
MSEDQAAAKPRSWRTYHRVGLALAMVLIALTVMLLPFVFNSIATQLLSRQDRVLYNGLTGERLSLTPPELDATHENFITIGVLSIDQVNSQATLAVSGNRACLDSGCATMDIHFYALDENASQRRGVPPVHTVTLNPVDVMFSETFTLPISGRPNMYPFDTYDLWLGISATRTVAGGKPQELSSQEFSDGSILSLQSLDSNLLMNPPKPIPPGDVRTPTDPYAFITVQSLYFREPTYLIVLAVPPDDPEVPTLQPLARD